MKIEHGGFFITNSESKSFYERVHEQYLKYIESYIEEVDDDLSSLEQKINQLDSMDVFSNDFYNEIHFPSKLFLVTLDRVGSIVEELIDITFETKFKDLHKCLSSIKNSLKKTLFDENDEKVFVCLTLLVPAV